MCDNVDVVRARVATIAAHHETVIRHMLAVETAPETALALSLAKHFGVIIAPHQLRDYIRANWNIIAPLAHAIHGEPK